MTTRSTGPVSDDTGQKVDFIATGVYRVTVGRIAEDWHLEDNLTFLQQIGFVAQ
jgi:predicted ester cyclase